MKMYRWFIALLLIGMAGCARFSNRPLHRPYETPGYPLPVTGRQVFPGSGAVPLAYQRFDDAGHAGMMYFLVSNQEWCLVSAVVFTQTDDREVITCNWRHPRGQYR